MREFAECVMVPSWRAGCTPRHSLLASWAATDGETRDLGCCGSGSGTDTTLHVHALDEQLATLRAFLGALRAASGRFRFDDALLAVDSAEKMPAGTRHAHATLGALSPSPLDGVFDVSACARVGVLRYDARPHGDGPFARLMRAAFAPGVEPHRFYKTTPHLVALFTDAWRFRTRWVLPPPGSRPASRSRRAHTRRPSLPARLSGGATEARRHSAPYAFGAQAPGQRHPARAPRAVSS